MKRPRPVMAGMAKKPMMQGMQHKASSDGLVPAALSYRKKAAKIKSRGNSYGI